MFIHAAGPKDRPSFFSPMLCFFIFLASNVFLSYFARSLTIGLWIFLFGIIVPLIFYGCSKGFISSLEISEKNNFSFPIWLCIVSLLIGLFLRIYHATYLCAWPTRDEGIASFGPLEFYRTGKPFFFFACGEWPPLYGWLQYLYFKLDTPSLSAFWRFPIFLSIVTLPVVWWAARQFFPKFVSLLIFGFFCVEFWPVYLARFSLSYGLIVFWQCLTLGVLGWVFNQLLLTREKIGAFLLGLVVAAGFYIYPPAWVSNAFFISVVMVGYLKPGRRCFLFVSAYLLGLLPFLAPLLIEIYLHGYGNHIRSLWTGSDVFSGSHLISIDFTYLSQIFWGGPKHVLYGPWWGGFLNPVSTSLFFLGIVELWTMRQMRIAWCVFFAFIVFVIPGFFSNGVEMMRVENLIPVLLVVLAFGARALMGSLKEKAGMGLVILLLISAGLNFYHLAVPFANAAQPASFHFSETRSEESYNAYQVIRDKAKQAGPGLLFLDFLFCPLDQTLYLATFPYNAGMNPCLKETKPTWACFLTNINYVPFLKNQLPDTQWYVVNSKTDPWDGQLVLGVFTLNDANRFLTDKWLRAAPIFHELTENVYLLPVDETGASLIGPLTKGYPLIQGDRFLESVFWEEVYFNHCRDKDFSDAFRDLSMILHNGYPAAHIYNEMGVLLYSKKDIKNARIALWEAIRLGGDHTNAPGNLKILSDAINR